MRYLPLAALALAAAPAVPALAQSATFTGAYAQNFDQLGPNGRDLTALGAGEWSVFRFNPGGSSTNATWNNTTGVIASQLSAGTRVTTQLDLFNPASPTTAAGGINAPGTASTSDPDRSLGLSPTGIAGTGLQLTLTNGTGGTLNSLAIAYDTTVLSTITTTNELAGYRVFYSLTGETGTWVAASALDTVTNPGVDPQFTQYLGGGTLDLAGGWAAGSTLLLRWIDDNARETSPDQIIALDNVTASLVTAVPEPATWGLMIGGFGLVGGTMRRRSRTAGLAAA